MMDLMVKAYPEKISAEGEGFSNARRTRKELHPGLQTIINKGSYGLRVDIFGVSPAAGA